MKSKSLLILSLLFFSIIACHEKYLIHSYIAEEGVVREAQIKTSYYMDGYRISDKPEEILLASGQGTIMITEQILSDQAQGTLSAEIFKIEPEINYRIAVSLPEKVSRDSLNINGRSLCQLIGRFNLPDSLKMYYCHQGYILIDSVKATQFFAILSGKYFNSKNDSLEFSGQFWIKKK
ncbi:MAG: hypothetical protein NTV06_05390 [candidate division Zixibacteria bacterium]|nr:hypothetical protein [candidate division Zixibacteria bacterium]